MELAKRLALQDPFALPIAKFSLKQMQVEMGVRPGITNAFQNSALTRAYRLTPGEDPMSGAARAREREAVFGDHT